MTDTAVIVPVMSRPHRAAPFMESLRGTTNDAHVYAIAREDDPETFNAWVAAGANVLCAEGHTFAEKVNQAYRLTGEPWLFIVGDDVKFHRDWLVNARLVAGTRYQVVGTNDLGSQRVMSGNHGTHLLIRRSYVDDVGASWDGPKVVCHEGYGHWYVDDEIVEAAKQRSAWIAATSSVVEHLHPMFRKADMDEVYALGQSRVKQDRELFLARLKEYTS